MLEDEADSRGDGHRGPGDDLAERLDSGDAASGHVEHERDGGPRGGHLRPCEGAREQHEARGEEDPRKPRNHRVIIPPPVGHKSLNTARGPR